jgi:hypothetical protein
MTARTNRTALEISGYGSMLALRLSRFLRSSWVVVVVLMAMLCGTANAQLVVKPGNARLCAGDKIQLAALNSAGSSVSADWTFAPAGSGAFNSASGSNVTFTASAASGNVTITAAAGADTGTTTLHLTGVCVDERGTFNASFYLGVAVDTFAGDETLKYLNPNDAGQLHERAVGGFDFAYRLFGDEHRGDPGSSKQRINELWIYGETVHGVRSADVDCNKQGSDFPTCQKDLTPSTNPGQQLFFILRNASSLEGYGGLRYEFLGIQQQSAVPANLYLKAQAGFLDMSGQNGSALDLHHIALGAIATKGDYQDSYLEVGWGRSDTFHKNHGRKKIDGYLERKINFGGYDPGISFFAQITVDTDLGRGSDGIQSYIGFSFDLTKIVSPKTK